MNLKEKFIKEVKNDVSDLIMDFSVLVTLVKLPTGAIEVITNTNQLETKIKYLIETYDDNFCLKANSSVQIVGYTIY